MAAPPQEAKPQEVALEEEDEFEEFEEEGEPSYRDARALITAPSPCRAARALITAPRGRPRAERLAAHARPPLARSDWDDTKEDAQREDLWEQVRPPLWLTPHFRRRRSAAAARSYWPPR